MPESPYEERTDGSLAEKMQRSLTVAVVEEAGRDSLVLTWDCPVCEHACRRSGKLNGRFVGLVRSKKPSRKRPLTIAEVIRCDCGQPHAGRPEDEQGCGFWAHITVVMSIQ